MRRPVVIVVPVLNRPHRVEPLMADVAAATPEPYRLLFVVDRNDTTELRALRRARADYLVVEVSRRTYACKINDGIAVSVEPLIFTAADDLHFHEDWLERATAKLRRGIAVVGTNDLTNPRVMAGEHSTHTLLTRAYAELGSIDNPTVVLHEGYPHEYVDDEFIGTAKLRGVFASAADSVVEHMHPYRKLAPVDNTYRRGWAGRRRGHALFEQRRHLWESTSSSPSSGADSTNDGHTPEPSPRSRRRPLPRSK